MNCFKLDSLRPVRLRCEYLENPLGLDPERTPRPRLSWRLESDEPGQRQTAYRIRVCCDKRTVWDTGAVRSDDTLHIPYAGRYPLRNGALYAWRVRVRDARGRWSAWSGEARWGTRPVWKAKWIGEQSDTPWSERESRPSPCLRKESSLRRPIRRAVAHVSALGLCEFFINGARVGDQVLAPEWTDYRARVQFQSYDVTALLRKGGNAFGLMLAAGWYAGRLGLHSWAVGGGERGFYGRWPRGLAQIMVTYQDGSEEFIGTDESWRYTLDGPIRGADLLDGETYDARRELAGWTDSGFDDSAWRPVETCLGPQLVPQANEPIRITERLRPTAITSPKPGVFIIDFGQNLTGWISLALRADSGTCVRLRHGEILDESGALYVENLRSARQTDTYICGGGGSERYEPRFTYHGFRYVEVTGLASAPDPAQIEACAVNSDAAEVGTFECSDPLLNRIMSAIRWTHRGNLHGIPTDCPQRDERLGWMGDIQVFAQTAIFGMDMAAFFTKWLLDVRDAQSGDGRFPDLAPFPGYAHPSFYGAPAWADAGVLVPWRQWVNYADRELLQTHFDSARRWVDRVWADNPEGLWRRNPGRAYGDWLNGDTLIMDGWPIKGGAVPIDVFATAFLAESTKRVAQMAAILGRRREATHYRLRAGAIRKAFQRAFVSPSGRVRGDTQAGYALALHFGLMPKRLEKAAQGHLTRTIRRYGGRFSTGIQSTIRLLMEVTRAGRSDLAYAMVQQKTPPSLGYMVEHGGTTIWERWDGWIAGRGPYAPGMNSFNHYALGAIGEWFYRVIGGLNPDEGSPGWKHFFVRPRPGGDLTWARVVYHSIRGVIRSEWRIEDQRLTLEVDVPSNTSATVQLPGRRPVRLGPGSHVIRAQTK